LLNSALELLNSVFGLLNSVFGLLNSALELLSESQQGILLYLLLESSITSNLGNVAISDFCKIQFILF
ncbi:hypothetical protein, partial [uncultured Nostoc sp.]|uniref:hypothetical protein n=1 Tax=uncultured Nostoc sp. TaxID=340711 RepID=UPI0035CA19BF